MRQWLEQEIKIARSDGVSRADNYPFLLIPEKPSKQAVLLVHGFSSSPREMFPLAEILYQHNFIVAGVRLPGHGTSPEDLAQRNADEWLETVRRGYQHLSGQGFTTSIGGLSTGAVLALNLALEAQPENLLLLSPFLRLRHPLAPLASWLHYIIPYQHKKISPQEQPFYYQRRPLKGIAQINTLCRRLQGKLGEIHTPSLVLASAGDKTIAKGTAEDIFQKIGSRKKSFHCYEPEVPHVLISENSPARSDVLNRCIDFLTR